MDFTAPFTTSDYRSMARQSWVMAKLRNNPNPECERAGGNPYRDGKAVLAVDHLLACEHDPTP
jgi:hypothetical protein